MFLGISYLEWSAALTTALCILLAGRNNIHTWWVGIVACVLYGFLFYEAKLYADATLQVFFVITGIIGWIAWVNKVRTKPLLIKAFDSPNSEADGSMSAYVRAKIHNTFAGPLKITNTAWSTFGLASGVAVLAAISYGMLLKTFTDAYAPMIDSLVLTFSVLAQVLLMRRKVETWPTWLIVNTLAVPLFFSRELYLSAAMYSVFWVNAIVSWRHWANLRDKQEDAVTAASRCDSASEPCSRT